MENAPSYLDDAWFDDPVVPDWVLARRTGNTHMLILMHNYTFTCTGQLTTWYFWWRINHGVPGCEVDFTLYILRPPVHSSAPCGTTVVGSHVETIRLYSESSIVSRRPAVLENVDRINVQEGDYIGLQISIGRRCSGFTEAWLRGKVSPNTVLLRRDGEFISPSLHCESEGGPFTQLGNALGFISASVGENKTTPTSWFVMYTFYYVYFRTNYDHRPS